MNNLRSYLDFLNEKKPAGAPDFHHSDAPDANGRFKELGIKDLAAWLIKTRKKDVKKISGSLTQQVVFNRNEDPKYAEKMEKVRKEVYKQLGRQDLIDNMKENVSNDSKRVLGLNEFKAAKEFDALYEEALLENDVRSLHFEIDPKKAEERKIALGKSQGEVSKKKQIDSADYSLRRFRKSINYGDGTYLGVFIPGSYDAAISTLGDGPHKKAVKKVKWNHRKYNQWLEDVASNGGAENAFDMAQNAKNEPGLIDWVKKNFRYDDPMQRIQWDIEGFAESVDEAFIGPFVFNDRMSDEELKAMYNGALDGYANYSKGFQHSKSDYKKAYQEIEKILKKRGVSVDESVVTEAESIEVGEYIKTQYGYFYKRVAGKVGGQEAFVEIKKGKEGKRKTSIHDTVDFDIVDKSIALSESLINEAKVNYDFSEDELKRVLKLLGRNASTEVKMIKAFEKAFGRKLTRDELFEAVNEAKNTIGLAFKEEQDYLDFKEFVAEQPRGVIRKNIGFDSKTKSWNVEMDVKVLDRIYGEGHPGNKKSGWYGGLPDDFESVIIESVEEAKMSKEKIESLIWSLENEKDSWHPSSASKKKSMLDKLKKDLSKFESVVTEAKNLKDMSDTDLIATLDHLKTGPANIRDLSDTLIKNIEKEIKRRGIKESVVNEAKAYKLKASEFGADTHSAPYNVKGEPTWRVHSTYAIDQVSGENNPEERDVVFFEAMPINNDIYIKIGGINNLKRSNGSTVGNNFGTTIEEWKNDPEGIAKEASEFLTDATHLKWINKKARSEGQAIKWALKDDYSSVIIDLVNKSLGLSESVNEAKLSAIHKAAKKGSYPVSIVVINSGIVVKQELVNTPAAVPAVFNELKKKYPNAVISVESRTGARLFSESILFEAIELEDVYELIAHHRFDKDFKKLSSKDKDWVENDAKERGFTESLTIESFKSLLKELNEAKPGPDGYMTGLKDEDQEDKEDAMKKQAEMDDDDPDAYKELPGDKEAQEKGKVKTSKHVKSYHELYGDKKDESMNEDLSMKIGKVVAITKYNPRKNRKELVDVKITDYIKKPGSKDFVEYELKGKKSKVSINVFKSIMESNINEEKAEGDRGPISDSAIETGLKNKAKDTGVPIALLRLVMRRGLAAWKSGHRPGATQQQWGYARVNSFLTKQPGTWGGADKDIAKEVRDGGHDSKLKKA